MTQRESKEHKQQRWLSSWHAKARAGKRLGRKSPAALDITSTERSRQSDRLTVLRCLARNQSPKQSSHFWTRRTMKTRFDSAIFRWGATAIRWRALLAGLRKHSIRLFRRILSIKSEKDCRMNLLKFWIGLLPPISIKQRFRYEKNRRIANRLQLGSWNFRSRQTNSTTRFFERKSLGVFKMSNQFVEIVQKASRLGWCTRLYCTTCLNHELREEFRKLAGEVGFELAEQLAELAPSEVVLLPNWENCIRLAFLQIALPGPQQKVLDAWANKLDLGNPPCRHRPLLCC